MSLQVTNLRRTFVSAESSKPCVVLSGFCLHVEVGEFLVLAGPSGVGKSTLLRLLAGLDCPEEGSIKIDVANREEPFTSGPIGQTLTQAATLVFQQYEKSLLPWQRIDAALRWGLAKESPSFTDVATPVLEAIGFQHEWRERWPSQLSGGQCQKIVVARALVNQPHVLLMDEPFGSLDAYSRYDLERHLLNVKKQRPSLIVVLATHDLEEAVFLADRVLVLGGKPVREIGQVLVKQPLSERNEAWKESETFARYRKQVRELVDLAAAQMPR